MNQNKQKSNIVICGNNYTVCKATCIIILPYETLTGIKKVRLQPDLFLALIRGSLTTKD